MCASAGSDGARFMSIGAARGSVAKAPGIATIEARWLGQSRHASIVHRSLGSHDYVGRDSWRTGRPAHTSARQNTTAGPAHRALEAAHCRNRVSPATTVGACRQAGPIDSRHSAVTSPSGTACTSAPQAARAVPKARASACRSSISTIGKVRGTAARAAVGRSGAPTTTGSAAQTAPCRNSRRLVRRSPSRAYLTGADPTAIRSGATHPLVAG